ncbi:LppX_LprAFG lipoprotein [Nocardioides panaciterrulae]|uniref:Lipoprotein LprG n=1 Tax=Nocardioides panaciterrulae TaxID=661492 RepID=A0A7Y9JAP8_9ACTN|nr:LppX_LprAFG lipoprotein [Nocardioides panaciterrulae]NYD41588.1 lipoprotein LprG [Nocardioides panaciterrulae]
MPLQRPTAALAALLGGLVLTGTLAACDSASSSRSEASPTQVLATAKKTLDRTSGVDLTLATDDLPSGVTGVQHAEGVATHAPAFDGKITVVLGGQSVAVPVVSVGGKVYVQLPFTSGWQDIDPGSYGAPDPAQLLSPDQGVSSLLTATTGVRKGDSVRGGTDNKEVLTTYSGHVSGAEVKHVLPGASGDFDATYTLTGDDQLRQAELTGVFYPHSDPMTYTLTFEDYGTDKDITAP